MQIVQRIELTSTQTSLVFSNIPQDGTDLMLALSIRYDGNQEHVTIQLNGLTTGFTGIYLANTSTGSYPRYLGNAARATGYATGIFATGNVYITGYTAARAKGISSEVMAANSTVPPYSIAMASNTWNSTAPVTSITLTNESGTNFSIGTSATLYKITAGSSGVTTS